MISYSSYVTCDEGSVTTDSHVRNQQPHLPTLSIHWLSAQATFGLLSVAWGRHYINVRVLLLDESLLLYSARGKHMESYRDIISVTLAVVIGSAAITKDQLRSTASTFLQYLRKILRVQKDALCCVCMTPYTCTGWLQSSLNYDPLSHTLFKYLQPLVH